MKRREKKKKWDQSGQISPQSVFCSLNQKVEAYGPDLTLIWALFFFCYQVSIRVYNDMSNEAVSFHWHGMFQTGSPWMDGVSMVSQCPIQPGEFFTYQ